MRCRDRLQKMSVETLMVLLKQGCLTEYKSDPDALDGARNSFPRLQGD